MLTTQPSTLHAAVGEDGQSYLVPLGLLKQIKRNTIYKCHNGYGPTALCDPANARERITACRLVHRSNSPSTAAMQQQQQQQNQHKATGTSQTKVKAVRLCTLYADRLAIATTPSARLLLLPTYYLCFTTLCEFLQPNSLPCSVLCWLTGAA
ncbi:unnamed protein product [Ceratitis capitata]|uniref:(Mediterranean fruit fly) hypothetical protein n=1 Tax=Ceratitis capitata TaxID=7213 RepID=A0A811URE3_CERCA|nr:unnamed protein product [Ceratitis capitata]